MDNGQNLSLESFQDSPLADEFSLADEELESVVGGSWEGIRVNGSTGPASWE